MCYVMSQSQWFAITFRIYISISLYSCLIAFSDQKLMAMTSGLYNYNASAISKGMVWYTRVNVPLDTV